MAAKSLKILVVDDDSDAADSLAELFELEDHEVTVAYSGEEAISAYRDTNFDVAFMDIMMPGKNGVESFLEIRKLNPQAQVYMMTGYSVEQLVQQAIDNGAMGVLGKPVQPQKVLSMLEEVHPAGIVLIAEDDPDLGPQLQEIISENGFECTLVKDGKQALTIASQTKIDVLILDLNLPVIDGIEVFTNLQRQSQAVPTIIITGHAAAHADSLESIRDMSVTGVLHKPFDPSMLLSKLDELAA
jgi:DNA-binding response OmpR family regulator